MLVIDFETRSPVDLKAAGAYNYAKHPDTRVICLSWVITNPDDAGEPEPSLIWFDDPLPPAVTEYLTLPDATIGAVNAEFDMLIWNHVSRYQKIPVRQWRDIAALCRVNALPGNLDDASRALFQQQKDTKGKRLISLLSSPDADGNYNNNPDLLSQMGAYCLRDTVLAAKIIKHLPPMSPAQERAWRDNLSINRRGILIDTELAKAACRYAIAEKANLAERMATLTSNAIQRPTQLQKLTAYLHELLPPELTALMVDSSKVSGFCLDAAVRGNLLASSALPDEARRLIECVEGANKSSVSKFQKMLTMACADNRVRGAFIYAGAGQTQRYSSKGLQLHNMARDCCSVEEAEKLKQKMMSGEAIPDVMQTLSRLLRPALIPAKGHTFVVSDWSGIEARVLPWLAGTPKAEPMLQAFREGEDVYLRVAEAMGRPRLIGKVATLACGYQGGVNAFASMARNYRLSIPESEALQVVQAWRQSNPWAVDFWRELDKAARHAVLEPEKAFHAGKVSFTMGDRSLHCTLPDGTVIKYPRPTITPEGRVSVLKASIKPKAGANAWPRTELYGGLLAENITQATAAALLREALMRLPNVVAHVHDEIIMELPDEQVAEATTYIQTLMECPPVWASNLPLAAVPVALKRYGNH